MEMITRFGHCRYCGEQRMVEVQEGASDAVINETASATCDCFRAREARQRQLQRVKCIANIDELLTEKHPDIAALFKGSIEAVQEHNIKKLTVNTYDNQTARMYECKDGIKVELEKKKKEENLA